MNRLEFIIVKLLFKLFSALSLQSGKKIADFIYWIISRILRYRRKIILQNLRLVYGDTLPMDQDKLLNSIYRNFVYLWMEFLQINRLNQDNLHTIFHLNNPGLFDEAIKEDKGCILLSGHFGNFEWLGQMLALLGHRVSGIAKRQRNPYVNDLVERIRKRKNIGVIYTKTAMRDGAEVLKNNEILAIVTDQDARKKGVFVDFMGHPSSTAVGPAIFHLRTGAPLVFAISIRRDYGQFDIHYAMVAPAAEPQQITDGKIIELTQLHASVLEKWVRQYPEQWFWMHRRWKTKPNMDKRNEKSGVV